MVAGLPRGEIGLFLPATTQRLGRLAPVCLAPQHARGEDQLHVAAAHPQLDD